MYQRNQVTHTHVLILETPSIRMLKQKKRNNKSPEKVHLVYTPMSSIVSAPGVPVNELRYINIIIYYLADLMTYVA